MDIEPDPEVRSVKGCNSKRKKRKKRKKIKVTAKTNHGYPAKHPLNDTYRYILYILAEPDPHVSYTQELYKSSDWDGESKPGWLYRVLSPSTVLLSLHDRARNLHVSKNRMAVTGGVDWHSYTIRATHAVCKEIWYYEATVEEMPEGSVISIGWGQIYADLLKQLGSDKFGYSWSTLKGKRYHNSRKKRYSKAYKKGDVLGVLIVLPYSEDVSYIPPTYKDKKLQNLWNFWYYIHKYNNKKALKSLKPLVNSKIVFYKNGVNQGVAFTDIYGGAYYPTISLYKSATVSVNFGPNFKFPPQDFEFKPMSEREAEASAEQTMADMLYLTENEGKLTMDNLEKAPVVRSVEGRSLKRKVATQSTKQGRGAGYTAAPKLPGHEYPLEHPFNNTYMYILAEPDPIASYNQKFDKSSDWAGKSKPGWLYRVLSPSTVLLALHDRAPKLHVSEDRLTVIGVEVDYCMIRATHAISKDTWYYEATVEEMSEDSATRIGWGQNHANLQNPLGNDKFGYSWGSRKGKCYHDSHGEHYSSAYEKGDVLGFLIVLPYSKDVNYIPPTYKDKPLINVRNHWYFKDEYNTEEALKSLKPLVGSKILFYKNGVNQGVAFTDIYGGAYYPTISLFKSATVSVNFGPYFKFPPQDFDFKPVFQRTFEASAEQTNADMLYLKENEGKLNMDISAKA